MAGKVAAVHGTADIAVTLVEVVYSTVSEPDEGDAGHQGFAVWRVRGPDGSEFRASAELSAEGWGEPGQQVVLVGKWVDHPRHGRQFQVESVRPHLEPGPEGIIRWLTRHPGVGAVTARRVVETLGPNVLEQVAVAPQLLDGIPGLTAERAQAVLLAVQDYLRNRQKASVLTWAHQQGFGPAQANAIWEWFGETAPATLGKEPWLLAQVPGFGFLRADTLAARLGVHPESPARLKAAVVYALADAAETDGHVYLPERELTERAVRLLREAAGKTGYGKGISWDATRMAEAARACAADRRVVEDSGRYYLPRLYRAEEKVREWIQRRSAGKGLLDLVEAARLAASPSISGQLDEVQRDAVTFALSMPLSVLTGGPGTGKTTTVQAVLRACRAAGLTGVHLAAPTGRAARRLVEVTGVNAQTIHRLLDYGPLEGGGFGPRKNRENPLEGRLLVVDESSMVDIELMAALVDAVPETMSVLLVGDANQLPPVGPGAPFHAIVGQGLAPVVELHRIYRQGQGSPIPVVAQQVNRGEVPAAGEEPGLSIRVYPRPPWNLPEKEREERARELRQKMAQDVLAAVKELKDRGYRPEEIQVLTPIRRGPLGVGELNIRLRELLNPRGKDRGVFAVSKREFWQGDRVMQVKNNYEKGVMNGETGTVVSTQHTVQITDRKGNIQYKPGILVRFDGGQEVGYWSGDCGELTLAYAVTVHKSQGSEYPAVVMVLGWDAYLLLQRQLVYTGMTRAAKHLVMLVEKGALEKAVETVQGLERYQAL